VCALLCAAWSPLGAKADALASQSAALATRLGGAVRLPVSGCRAGEAAAASDAADANQSDASHGDTQLSIVVIVSQNLWVCACGRVPPKARGTAGEQWDRWRAPGELQRRSSHQRLPTLIKVMPAQRNGLQTLFLAYSRWTCKPRICGNNACTNVA
jgi:hypothetical protein